MRINSAYIFDRHEAPACDEKKWADNIPKPAEELCRRADWAKKIEVKDDEFWLIEELVTGAWHYEYGEDFPIGFVRAAKRILAKWEKSYREREKLKGARSLAPQ